LHSVQNDIFTFDGVTRPGQHVFRIVSARPIARERRRLGDHLFVLKMLPEFRLSTVYVLYFAGAVRQQLSRGRGRWPFVHGPLLPRGAP